MSDDFDKKPCDEEPDVDISDKEDSSTESEQPAAEESTETETRENDGTNPFVRFFRNWGAVLSVCGVLLLVAAMGVIAFVFGGDIYDKVAMFWSLAAVIELAYYILVNRSGKTLAVLITTAALAVGCVVLYGLEVGGILP